MACVGFVESTGDTSDDLVTDIEQCTSVCQILINYLNMDKKGDSIWPKEVISPYRYAVQKSIVK